MQLKFAAIVASALALAVGSGSAASVLVPRQSSTNVVVNLSAEFNNPTVLDLIDKNLTSGTRRTSGIQLAWMPWNKVPGVVKTRAKKPHSENDPVIRISMSIHRGGVLQSREA